ncbi:hypothetical protein C6P52_07845 [Enterococcus mundtii]|uniref:Uncharacterized protein n=1 Tax=Enterococcus mundtii TaxID=53346 RepID=A0A242KVF9_ENTMU|nr:hypothetical protein [Enterococcus mundtii]OTP25224.1 hypothetical protein A5802_002377 [Enterococcus mundtii]PTO37874.1 hypothetical protein C6P54_15065 [Enterococcus mundtii]PTO38776.1 hypothetical protein C6P52_07845 [Enterococcus mundtii]
MKIILSNILRNVLLASYLSTIVIGLIKIFLKQEFVIFSLPDILLILGLAILNEEKIYLKIGKLKAFLLTFLLLYTFESTVEYRSNYKIVLPLNKYLWIIAVASLGMCFYYLRNYFVKQSKNFN